MAANLVSAKVSVFLQTDCKDFPQVFPKALLGTNTIKHKTTSNQRLDELFITKQEQKVKNKNKIGLPPNKRYRLTPLARHESENRSKYCHLDPYFFLRCYARIREVAYVSLHIQRS